MIRFCLPLACLVSCFLVADASAQRLPGYQRGNTISPYFNLLRGSNFGGGGAFNYFTLVRPMQNQQRFNQMQMSMDQRFQQQLMMMNPANQFGPQAYGPTAGAPSILHPGSQGFGQATTAASFFNYSHYYGVPNTGPSLGSGRRTR